MEKVRCISYIRFSKNTQAQGDSLRRQTKLSEDWLAKHPEAELDTSINIRDLGVSAFKGKNRQAGLGVFLEAVEQGRILPGTILLVESLDRLSRQQITEALTLMLGIIEKGIRIITLMDGHEFNQRNINEPAQLMFSIMIMARAHEESATKSARVSAAWRAKQSKADKEVISAHGPSWLRLGENRKWKVIPEKAAIIRRMAKMYIDGNGTIQICHTFNKEGVPTLNERTDSWNIAGPIKVLKSRSLIGEYQPMKYRKPFGEVIPNYYPEIISKADFSRIQQILDRNGASAKKKAGGRGGVCNLFTYVAKCMVCGSSMHYYYTPRNNYLWCSKAKRGMGCTNVSWNYKDFEARFLGMVDEVLSITNNEDARVRELRDLIVEADDAMVKLKKRIQGWQDAIGDATTKSIRVGLIQRLEDAEAECDSLKKRQNDWSNSLRILSSQSVEHDLHELKELIKNSKNEAVRRKLIAQIRILVDRIEIHTGSKVAQVVFKNGYLKTICGKGANSETVNGVLGEKVFYRGNWDDEVDVESHADELGNIITEFVPKK